MKKRNVKPYLFILLSLFLILTIPPAISEKVRDSLMEKLLPVFGTKFDTHANEEIKRLELENKLLYANFIQLQSLVENSQNVIPSHQATPGKVIFRSPNSWYSSLWINLGEEHNQLFNFAAIQKNSPVLIGDSIIGVIDYLGKKQSRVRLITDSALNPAVRVLRCEEGISQYLAKGELRGAGKPLFRKSGNLLIGIGFNYDFADDKGPAKDLRTGDILKPGDLLVTTGMDGVFPADLNVAKITKIYPLKEGDYYYELEAEPTAGKLDDVSLVFVLPPVGFDLTDQPPPIGYESITPS